jgi:hypothetical protein
MEQFSLFFLDSMKKVTSVFGEIRSIYIDRISSILLSKNNDDEKLKQLFALFLEDIDEKFVESHTNVVEQIIANIIKNVPLSIVTEIPAILKTIVKGIEYCEDELSLLRSNIVCAMTSEHSTTPQKLNSVATIIVKEKYLVATKPTEKKEKYHINNTMLKTPTDRSDDNSCGQFGRLADLFELIKLVKSEEKIVQKSLDNGIDGLEKLRVMISLLKKPIDKKFDVTTSGDTTSDDSGSDDSDSDDSDSDDTSGDTSSDDTSSDDGKQIQPQHTPEGVRLAVLLGSIGALEKSADNMISSSPSSSSPASSSSSSDEWEEYDPDAFTLLDKIIPPVGSDHDEWDRRALNFINGSGLQPDGFYL